MCMSNFQWNKNVMNRFISLLFLLVFIIFPTILFGQNKSEIKEKPPTSFVFKSLCTPDPSIEAKALYRYLQDIFGEKILSGQMTTERGIKETEYIKSISLKQPALQGFNFEYENNNKQVTQNAIKWWQDGGIPLIMWHWGAPSFSEGYENSKKKIEIEKCFQEGTPEYESFWKELKKKADHLDSLRIARVPVLWCPFHEQSDGLFWWGKQGSAQFIKLWQTMYNYFVRERKLNNLIWVQCFSENITIDWFPGNSYVDIIGAGSYENNADPRKDLYNKVRLIANDNRTPLAYNECANIPEPDECKKNGAMWSWWMQRADSYLTNIDKDYLDEIYRHNLIVTLDEVPKIVRDYRGEAVKRYFYTGTIIPFNELKGFDLGTKSGNFSINNDQLEIEAKGNGIQGKKDECYFAFKQLEKDFDVSVQVLSLSAANLYTMAGIMVRENLSKKSPHVYFQVFPNNNPKNYNSRGCELKYRTEKSKQTTIIYPDPDSAGNKFDVDFPNTWIRLKRRGNIFKSYISHDNKNWHIYSVHTQEMPEKLLVGLAVSSRTNEIAAKAKFKDLQISWE